METVVVQTGFATAASTDYRLMVRAQGTTVHCYVNDRQLFGAPQTVQLNRTATRAGIYRHVHPTHDAGSTLDTFAAWPASVPFPAEAGPGPTTVGRGVATLETSRWEGIAAPGAEWTQYTKRWVVRADDTARLFDLNNLLIKDVGRSDYEVSTDILIRDTDGFVMAGLAVRVKDAANFHFGRIYKIPGDPTFEIELGTFVNWQGHITRYIPITDEVALGQTVRFRLVANGPWITAYLGDVPKITYYTTEFLNEPRAGLYSDSSDVSSGWDNWEVRALGA